MDCVYLGCNYCKKDNFDTGYCLQSHWENECQNLCPPLCICTCCTKTSRKTDEKEKKHVIFLNQNSINDDVCFWYILNNVSCGYQTWKITWADFVRNMY